MIKKKCCIDWSLCTQPESRKMIWGFCMYQGFLTEWGECKVPGAKQFICHPIKKYRSDLKFIMNSPGLESRKIKKIVDK